MSHIIDITTVVPAYSISNQEVLDYYSKLLENKDAESIRQKLPRLIANSHITTRYSCLPDFNSQSQELFTDGNYEPAVDKRLKVYMDHVVPLSIKATDKLLFRTKVAASEITHIITVSCTGMMAPGLEFHLAEHYNLLNAEKIALNFLGCYAAIKAIKHANYIATADPQACILVVCAELCSIHFNSSMVMEDVIANLLFADGAAALMICGNNSRHIKNNNTFRIDLAGSATIPNTTDLMTWSISPSSFRMYLSKEIVGSLRNNVKQVIHKFMGGHENDTTYWAIHPGGYRIVKAVQEALNLEDKSVADSLEVLKHFGNMSSPTILFILKNIFARINPRDSAQNQQIFACAFGPGLNVEMMLLSPAFNAQHRTYNKSAYVAEEQV